MRNIAASEHLQPIQGYEALLAAITTSAGTDPVTSVLVAVGGFLGASWVAMFAVSEPGRYTCEARFPAGDAEAGLLSEMLSRASENTDPVVENTRENAVVAAIALGAQRIFVQSIPGEAYHEPRFAFAAETLRIAHEMRDVEITCMRRKSETRANLQSLRAIGVFHDTVFRSIPTAVITLDTDGILTFANRAAKRLFGKRSVGVSVCDVVQRTFAGETATQFADRLAIAARDESELTETVILTHSGGEEKVLAVSAAPLKSGRRTASGTVALFNDISDTHRMERELNRLERLAEIGQLTAAMAHEIRNPLTSIKGAAQLLSADCDIPNPTREFLKIILDEVSTLSDLTSEFLEFARPLEIRATAGDVMAVVSRVAQSLTPHAAQRSIAVICDHGPGLPIMCFDSLRIGQAARNLVLNAIDASPKGGHVRVSAQFHPALASVEIAVEDDGSGITSDRIQRIFAPFYTTKAKGTGLGLSITQKIADGHGGRLTVCSEPGHGARFSLWLPAAINQQVT